MLSNILKTKYIFSLSQISLKIHTLYDSVYKFKVVLHEILQINYTLHHTIRKFYKIGIYLPFTDFKLLADS